VSKFVYLPQIVELESLGFFEFRIHGIMSPSEDDRMIVLCYVIHMQFFLYLVISTELKYA